MSEVVKVYDGDTITVDIDQWPALVGDHIGVRIAGIDTPEIKGKCVREKFLANEARQVTASMTMEGQRMELRNIERYKYFRIVAVET